MHTHDKISSKLLRNRKLVLLAAIIPLIASLTVLTTFTQAQQAYAVAGPTISSQAVSTPAPKWGATVIVNGTATTTTALGFAVRINWGDSSFNNVGITAANKFAGTHIYAPAAVGNKTITLQLFNTTSPFTVVNTKTIPIVVQKHTTVLALNPVTNVPWGTPVPVAGGLLDQDSGGAGVSGKLIAFTATPPVFTIAPVATANATGAYSSLGVAPPVVGSFAVQAGFIGDGAYLPAVSPPQLFNTTRHQTILTTPTLSSTSVPWGKTFGAGVVLQDVNGGSVGIGNKTIIFGGTGVASPVGALTSGTGSTGVVTLTAPGNGTGASVSGSGKTVGATFLGDALYLPTTSTSADIQVKRHLTALSTPTLSDASIKWGKTFTASATIIDLDNGNSTISGRSVTFIGSAVGSSGTGITDGSGSTGDVTITAQTATGTGKLVKASFASDDWYWQSKSTTAATIDLLKHATAFVGAPVLDSPTATFPGTVGATATLIDTDASSVGINGVKVTFRGSAIIPQVVTTDSNGDASATLNTASLGLNLKIYTTFAGNSLYEAAVNSPKASINVI